MNGHNHENKDGNREMWSMMIMCLLPLILLYLGSKLDSPYSWIIFIVAAIVMFGHHFAFSGQKRHDHVNNSNPEGSHSMHSVAADGQNSERQTHKKHGGRGGCCG